MLLQRGRLNHLGIKAYLCHLLGILIIVDYYSNNYLLLQIKLQLYSNRRRHDDLLAGYNDTSWLYFRNYLIRDILYKSVRFIVI